MMRIRLSIACAVLFSCGAAHAGSGVYDVRDFGAKGDGVTKDTRALQAAIDAASRAGGGRVLVSAGTYLTGSLFLRNGVDFHVAAGTTVKGSSDKGDYNRWDVCPQNNRSEAESHEGGHLFLCIEQHDVTLSGEGTIDGNGTAFAYDRDGRVAYVHADIVWRPAQMIYFVESERVGVSGLKLRNAPYWTLLFHGCEHVTVADLDVATSVEPLVHNGDGIAIDCCEHVSIARCTLDTSDDAIDLRANTKPLRRRRDCAFVTVRDCTISSGQDAIRIGVGDGRVRHASFSDIVVRRARKCAVNFSATWFPSRGVDFEDISFDCMTVTCPDFGRIHRLFATEDSKVENIRFSNIDARVERPMRIWARPGTAPFRNITFTNVNLTKGVEAFNVEGLTFAGGTAGPADEPEAVRERHRRAYLRNPICLEDYGSLKDDRDVVVYGATKAGMEAAAAAMRSGKRVLVVEPGESAFELPDPKERRHVDVLVKMVLDESPDGVLLSGDRLTGFRTEDGRLWLGSEFIDATEDRRLVKALDANGQKCVNVFDVKNRK